MKNKLLFILFLFWSVHAMSQNKKINLNDSGKIEMKSTAAYKNKNDLLKTVRTRAFTLSKTLQSNLNIKVKDTLELDLFADKKYKAYIDKIEKDINGTLSIRARMVDYPMGYCIIATSSDKRSLVSINIPELDEKYISESDSQTKMSYLLELDKNQPDNFSCGEPLIPPADTGNAERNVLERKNKQNISSLSDKGVDDHAQIDIMVVYTQTARESRESENVNMNAAIATMVAYSNLVLEDSKVGITLNLVHSREINYTETEDSTEDLYRLQLKTDGFMDEVHQWRDQYKADLVILVAKIFDVSGRANTLHDPLGSPDYGFSIVTYRSTTHIDRTLIHEIGHNMGVGHHKQQKDFPGPGVFPYSAGWRWKGTDGKMYCSVMSYNSGYADDLPTGQRDLFSNPSINHAGAPTGHPTEGDAARTLRETKHIIAAYRELTSTCTPPTKLDVIGVTTNSARLVWDIGAQDYTIEYKISASSIWSISTTNHNSYNLSGLAANTTYNWRVRTNCTTGGSSEYATKSFTTAAIPVCNTPTGLNDDAAANSATLAWDIVSGARYYMLEYKTSASSTWNPPITVATNTYTLPNLIADTNYNWRVRTNCTNDVSSEYATRSFTTDNIGAVPCIDMYEPNDLSSDAYRINFNTVYSAGIGSATDKDSYQFTLDSASDIVITLENLPKDYDLKLYSYGGMIDNSATRGVTNEIITNNLPAGTYYVFVYGYSGAYDITQCYNLKVEKPTTSACSVSTGLNANATAYTANLKWNAVNGAKNYTIDYKTTSLGWSKPFTVTTTTYLLQGLTNTTNYNWRVRTNCTTGDSSEYATKSFTTETPVCHVPTALNANATFNTADLKWNSVSGAKSYTVEYKASTSSTWSTLIAVTTTTSPKRLTSATTYNWRVRTNCTNGGSSEYATGSFTTAEIPVCPVPAGLNADATANLKWNAVSGAKSYTLEYKTSVSSTWSTPITVTTTTHTLPALITATTYNWRVRTNCTTDVSSQYATSSFTTAACSVPTGLTHNITGNSATLVWDFVSGIQSYTVEYKTSTSSTWSKPIIAIANSYTLSGLKNNTTYYWKVKANCFFGNSSEYTQQIDFTIAAGTCKNNYEPNDTKLNATNLEPNKMHYAAIGTTKDKDLYKFTLNSLSSIKLALENLPKNYILSIYSSGGSPLLMWEDYNTDHIDYPIFFEDLSPGTYYMSISGDSEPNQCYSIIYRIKTKDNFCSTPTGLNADTTANTVNLKWNAVNGAQYYTLEYKTSASSVWNTPIIIATNSYTLPELPTNTSYDWRVRTNCINNGSLYATKNFTTATTAVCNVPTGLTSADPTTNSINLKWNAVSGAQSYTVEYKTLTSSTWIPASTVSTNSYTLPKLTAGTTYNWKVRTNCTNGANSEYTDGFPFFETLSAQPTCVTKYEPNNTKETAHSINLNTVHSAGIDKASDQDYYKFTLSALSDIVVTLQNLPKNYDLKLLNSIGTQIGMSTQSGTTNEIISLNSQPAGTYYVQVYGYNGAFDANQCYNLKVEATATAVCAVPTGLTPADPTANSINLKWNAVSGAQSYTVEYKTLTSSTWIPVSTVSTNSYTLQGLTANTTYNWQVRTNCTTGANSKYTEDSFTTPSAEVACNPNAYEPNSYNGNAHLINLNTTYKAGIQKRLDKDFYKFILNASSDIVVTLKDLPQNYDLILKNSAGKQFGLLGNKTGTADEIITVNNLVAGTYYVQVYGYNSAFDANKCYTLKIATATTAVCTPPTGLANSNLTANSASLKWNAVSGARDYTVEYKTSTSSAWKSSSVGTTTHPLEGLTPNTTYNWQVKTNCTTGGSSTYATGNFTTIAIPVVCPVPTVSTVSGSVTSNSATLQWYLVSGAQNYTVEYKTSVSSTWSVPNTTSSNLYSIKGLIPNTTYNWQVRTNCTNGGSSTYATGNFTTIAIPVVCPVPTVSTVSGSVTSNSATLQWYLVSGAQNYTVEYKTSASSTWSVPNTTSSNLYSIKGLIPNTTYNWQVRTNCTSGSSSAYAQGTFTTTSDETACDPFKYESNNTRASAQYISLNTTYKAGIQKALDKDYYKFTLSFSSDVEITLENTPKNYDFQLLNYLGSYIDSGFMSGNGKTIKRALARGTYYINITAFSRDYDASQCYALRINTPSGSSSPSSNETVVNDKNTILSSNVTLYPNPVDDMINIKGLVSDQEYTQLTIIDRNGGIVKISQVKVEDIIRVDVSDLSPNIYHLTILGKNFRFIKK